MKSKKSNQANQEDKKHLYIFIGIIISLSFALNLLEWKSFKKKTLTIETSFVPKLIEEPILEIKPIQIPKPVKTPLIRFDVIEPSICLSLFPAAC